MKTKIFLSLFLILLLSYFGCAPLEDFTGCYQDSVIVDKSSLNQLISMLEVEVDESNSIPEEADVSMDLTCQLLQDGGPWAKHGYIQGYCEVVLPSIGLFILEVVGRAEEDKADLHISPLPMDTLPEWIQEMVPTSLEILALEQEWVMRVKTRDEDFDGLADELRGAHGSFVDFISPLFAANEHPEMVRIPSFLDAAAASNNNSGGEEGEENQTVAAPVVNTDPCLEYSLSLISSE